MIGTAPWWWRRQCQLRAFARSLGIGATAYVGRGWVIHLSTEDGLQVERATHRTLRLGFVIASRGRHGR